VVELIVVAMDSFPCVGNRLPLCGERRLGAGCPSEILANGAVQPTMLSDHLGFSKGEMDD